MEDIRAVLLLPGLVLVGLVVVVVLALVWQRQGLNTQQQAMSHVEESLALSRRSVRLMEESNMLAEEMIKNQQAILDLLRRSTTESRPEEAIRQRS